MAGGLEEQWVGQDGLLQNLKELQSSGPAALGVTDDATPMPCSFEDEDALLYVPGVDEDRSQGAKGRTESVVDILQVGAKVYLPPKSDVATAETGRGNSRGLRLLPPTPKNIL